MIDFKAQSKFLKSELEKIAKSRNCTINGKKIIAYHGTSLNRAENILKEGFMDPLKMACEFRGSGTNAEVEQGLAFLSYKKDYAAVYSHIYSNRDKDTPVFIEIEVCIINMLKDEDITSDFRDSIYLFAKDEYDKGNEDLLRFTYNRVGGSAYQSMVSGWRGYYTSKITGKQDFCGISKLLDILGYDAVAGADYNFLGDNLSFAINHPDISILNMKIIEISEKELHSYLFID